MRARMPVACGTPLSRSSCRPGQARPGRRLGHDQDTIKAPRAEGGSPACCPSTCQSRPPCFLFRARVRAPGRAGQRGRRREPGRQARGAGRSWKGGGWLAGAACRGRRVSPWDVHGTCPGRLLLARRRAPNPKTSAGGCRNLLLPPSHRACRADSTAVVAAWQRSSSSSSGAPHMYAHTCCVHHGRASRSPCHGLSISRRLLFWGSCSWFSNHPAVLRCTGRTGWRSAPYPIDQGDATPICPPPMHMHPPPPPPQKKR